MVVTCQNSILLLNETQDNETVKKAKNITNPFNDYFSIIAEKN